MSDISNADPIGNSAVVPCGLEMAITLATRFGWAVFPLNPATGSAYSNESVAAVLGISTPAQGDGGFHLARSDEASVRAMFTNWPHAQIGIATGAASGIYVLDIDRKNGKDGFATIDRLGLIVGDTFWTNTQSGGRHYFYTVPRDGATRYKSEAGALGAGIDRKGDGGLVRWYGGAFGCADGAPIVLPPEWMLWDAGAHDSKRCPLGDAGLSAPSLDAVCNGLSLVDPDDLGFDQWIAMLAAAKQAAWNHGTPDEIEAMLLEWCARYHKNDERESRYQINQIQETALGWRSMLKRIPALQASLSFGDKGKADATPTRAYADMLNDAAKLTPDDADTISTLCHEAGTLPAVHRETLLQAIRTKTGLGILTLRSEASQAGKDSEPDHLILARAAIDRIGVSNVLHADDSFWLWESSGVWKKRDDIAIKQRVQATIEQGGNTVTAARVAGVTDVMRSELYRADHTFNIGNPDVVNCLNGELELIAGQWTLQPHRREHYRTTQIPVAYDPTAEMPLFWQFLHDVFRDDQDRDDKILAVMELIGYTLMSHAKHEKFVMLIGGGANGKSVLLSVMEALVGWNNVGGVQPSQFASKWQRAHLHMKLANIVTELKQGEVIADAELKAITSGELTTVEFKNGQPFNMRAYATCWFGTNHLPHTRDFSDALFRRATILTFNRTFTASEQDHNLKSKLIAELPGILRYALAYYAHATVYGFTNPVSSRDAKHKWRMEADQVAQFVDERCTPDPDGEVTVAEIYRQFRDWATQSGIHNIVRKAAMGDRLERLGYKRKHSGQRFITGLKLPAIDPKTGLKIT